ncbi:hypothetical protein [Candidatus Syntrophosphaera thermopropionivorans]|uniref:Uncharacterized protein n=1 Tax=Candidatus Syntrophosphaera thermopropionivorans TaxID=2593015 RepID=A0AC61QJ11_9BACT|nr:hypothetical protein [Candidatus Syntrophosphaera thermopropionivorans]TDF72964.1 hypothetical protein E0946_04485 [Candidatus Syntrophosphaera thermopropionivorans]
MDYKYFGIGSPNDQKSMQEAIDGLCVVPGTCIFLDICNSTKIKNKENLQHWIIRIRNTFIQRAVTDITLKPLKIIGDELMFYIPDSDLNNSGENFASLIEVIIGIISPYQNELSKLVLPLKGAIHHCSDVYAMTFYKDENDLPVPDYYGSGIDLTARLMEKAVENRLVVSQDFFNLIQDYKDTVEKFRGPYIEYFKGFDDHPTKYWYWQYSN